MTRREDALEYHRKGRPGKIAVVPTKPLTNQRDLALARGAGQHQRGVQGEQDRRGIADRRGGAEVAAERGSVADQP